LPAARRQIKTRLLEKAGRISCQNSFCNGLEIQSQYGLLKEKQFGPRAIPGR
jgi:hypothetical protein